MNSAQYFVEIFRLRGIPFDKIFAFEHEKMDPYTLWDSIPEDMLGIYVPINHGVIASDEKFNPWRLLTQIALEIDYVLVKMDIGMIIGTNKRFLYSFIVLITQHLI